MAGDFFGARDAAVEKNDAGKPNTHANTGATARAIIREVWRGK
jgi:hypothetical protein